MLFPRKLLENKGYHVREVSRGGDVTVHEPGQLVVYFVMPLKAKAVRDFVDGIVNSVKNCLKNDFDITAEFDPQKPGLWVKSASGAYDQKICSIGFDLTQKVSMHGIALNICNTLEGFSLIVPCGISGVKMTTMSKELGRHVSVEDVAQKLSVSLGF
jgi:lipoyl(octanoyl) transferase